MLIENETAPMRGDTMILRELLAGAPLTGGNPDLDMEISSISYDTRTLEPGALFVAMAGDKTDGHRYIQTALDRGAAAVLCQRAPEYPGPWLTTEDSRRALALTAANWFGRPGDAMTLAAVTGTNGKTTTTSLLKELLERTAGAKVGLIGTNRNMIGEAELPAPADGGRGVHPRGDGDLLPRPGSAPHGRAPLPGGGVYQPDPGPPGLPPHYGGVPGGQGAAV